MLFWAPSRRKFFATVLTPAREDLLRKKYSSIPSATLTRVIGDFRDKAEYLEWVLRNVSRNPEVPYRAEDYRGLVTWWDEAKKIQDPRIQQHSQFHQTAKWDLGAYTPERVRQIQTRYPIPTKARELFFQHNLPARLVARKENPEGVWDLVEIDTKGVMDLAEKEIYDAYNMIALFLTETVRIRVFNLRDVLILNDGALALFPLSITHNTDNPQSLLPNEIDTLVTQNITGPLARAGWVIHHDTGTSSADPGYDLIPPSLAKAIKLACQYGEGTNWCTTNAAVAMEYLQKGPLYIVLRDGYPVVQAWANIQDPMNHFQVMNRKDLPYSSQDPGYDQVNELLKTHTVIPTIDWEAVQELFESSLDDYEESVRENYIPGEDFSWLPDGYSADSYDEVDNLMWIMNKVSWVVRRDKKEKYILWRFIHYSDRAKAPPEELDEYVEAVLDNRDWTELVRTGLDSDDESYEQDVEFTIEEIEGPLYEYLDKQLERLTGELESAGSSWYEYDNELQKIQENRQAVLDAIESRDWGEVQALAHRVAQNWSGFGSDFEDEITKAAFGEEV